VENVVEANIKAALDSKPEAAGQSFNIGCGTFISINELYNAIAEYLGTDIKPNYLPPRTGDVKDSVADISAAGKAFGYKASISVREGLDKCLEWYKNNQDRK